MVRLPGVKDGDGVPQTGCKNPKAHGYLQAKMGRVTLPKYRVTLRSLIIIEVY